MQFTTPPTFVNWIPFCSMEYDEETPLGSCLAPLVFSGETLFD